MFLFLHSWMHLWGTLYCVQNSKDWYCKTRQVPWSRALTEDCWGSHSWMSLHIWIPKPGLRPKKMSCVGWQRRHRSFVCPACLSGERSSICRWLIQLSRTSLGLWCHGIFRPSHCKNVPPGLSQISTGTLLGPMTATCAQTILEH